jgi:cell division protein FtsW
MNRRTDPWLISIVAILIALGLVMVYSASAFVAGEENGNELHFFTRQSVAIALGIGLCTATAVTPTRVMRKYRWALYVACLLGLVLTFVPGIQHRANGAARWIGFGGANLQPSEFAKIAVIIALGHYLDRWRGRIGDWRVLLQGLLIPVPVLCLIIFQPDFGTTAIIAGSCALMLFIAGMRPAHIGVVSVAGLIVGVPVMIAESYRVARLTSFLDPWASADAEGYHVIQSWVAIHSGGVWGQGLGNSMAKLHFLPEPWTDFIGAVIAEELGLIRLVGVIGLYAMLVWRGLHIARRARDAFGMYVAGTITAVLGIEAFFNFGVAMGIVPPKGLVLPFISYGASAMESNLWAVGVLLSIAAESDGSPVTSGWPNRRLAAANPPATVVGAG